MKGENVGNRRRGARLVAAVATVVLVATPAVQAQDYRAPRTSDGEPDASWIFPPINGKYEIKVGAELANALNGDAQLFVNPVSGLPTGRGGGDIAYQRPTEYRFNVGLSF